MEIERRQQLTIGATAIMLVLCALWGLQQVTIKIANEGISPIMQAGIRSIISVLCLTMWMSARRIQIFRNDGTLFPGLICGFLFAIEFSLLFVGLDYTSASRAVIFINTSPFFVVLGVYLFVPKEKLSLTQIAGMLLAFVGIIVVFGDSLTAQSSEAWKGDLIIFIAAILWGATTVVVRASKLIAIEPSRTLYYQLIVSAIVLPPASYLLGESGVTNLSPLILVCLIYQSVIVAFASYLIWFWLITHYPVSKLSSYHFFTPVFGVGFGVMLLSEPLTLALLAGLILVATGIYIVNKK